MSNEIKDIRKELLEYLIELDEYKAEDYDMAISRLWDIIYKLDNQRR